MKKIAFVLMAVLISAAAFSNEPGETWVKTDEGQSQCEKVSLRKGYLIKTCTGGEQEKIPLDEVSSYSRNGKVYIKHAIYTEEYKPGVEKEEVFMRLVASKDGMDLLRYVGSKGTREFVFRGNELVQELIETNPNRKEYHEFFGI